MKNKIKNIPKILLTVFTILIFSQTAVPQKAEALGVPVMDLITETMTTVTSFETALIEAKEYIGDTAFYAAQQAILQTIEKIHKLAPQS